MSSPCSNPRGTFATGGNKRFLKTTYGLFRVYLERKRSSKEILIEGIRILHRSSESKMVTSTVQFDFIYTRVVCNTKGIISKFLVITSNIELPLVFSTSLEDT